MARLTLGRPVPNGSRFTKEDYEFKGKTSRQLIRWHKRNILFGLNEKDYGTKEGTTK